MNQTTLCVFPWNNLTIQTDGTISRRCEIKTDCADTKVQNKQQIEELFNTEQIKEIRRFLKAGIKTKYCKSYWDKETLGLISPRQQGLKYFLTLWGSDFLIKKNNIRQY